MAERRRIIDMDDGDSMDIVAPVEFYITCYDCELTHKVKAIKAGKNMRLTFWRDNRRTSQKRRRFAETVGKTVL